MPIRYLLNQAGFGVGSPRLPLTEPDPEDAAKLDKLISKYQIDLEV